MKQSLKGVSKTLLIPLWDRAFETKHPNPIIKDEKAVEIMENIRYDFTKFDDEWPNQVSIAIRTELLDNATKVFIKNHPQAVIINIGCGLDTRFSRLDNGKIHWYDLDLPEAIHVRKQFFNETDRYNGSQICFRLLMDRRCKNQPVRFNNSRRNIYVFY